MNKTPHVLQFICSTAFYGAERWILALCRNAAPGSIKYSLAVTQEDNAEELELVKQFKLDGGDTFSPEMKHKFDYGVVSTIAEYCKKHKVDAIHTHGYKSDIIGILAGRKANIPVVVTPHGFENASDIKLRTFIWLGCKALKYADKVVPLSPQLVKDVEGFGITEPQLEYIQNGVDLSEVDNVRNAPAKLSKDKKRIGFIGQMISRKNIDDILDIFDDLAKTRDDIELLLLGDGDERARLEEYSETLNSKKDIHFLGYKDNRLDYLKSFDLFVMTSTLEGIPRCLMEACGMGIPVAAYEIPGVNELVKHQETGLLAELSDKKALTQYWLTLLDDADEANRLSTNANHYVNKHYSAKRMADEYLDLFTRILN
ncbi:glycosyltransferase [Glaciecola petra]|uniref:Glycosyltransferase n=1 Tax=Glaciecola petra TaxID=3075602 RepID=A0ABU2ZMM0_9ALTE|nr:glycosyltransferase [Aestuariibacter sp. P117]MDT0593604.1 glycosyltransferase [Aestuariibacter sp. P117]